MPITGHRARTAPGGAQKIWALPESLEIGPLLADLAKVFPVRAEKDLVRVRKWFDTDDWRLYQLNLLLFLERRRWHLLRRDSDELLATFSGRKCEMFRFARDFPVSKMRTLLEPVLAIRSLQPLVTQDSSTMCVHVLNRDRKTVALVYFDDHAARETGAVFRSVILKGVRGYAGNFNQVSSFFSTCGIRDEIPPHAAFDEGVRSIGRTPLDYSSKFHIELQGDMTSRHAMVRIYRQLLKTMEHNEKGVVDDLDTEFLHDFRVAVRRTRSGLGQVKQVLPPDIAEKVKNDFSWLGNITGTLRDLDVYLLDRNKYLERLPATLRPPLEDFFADMAQRRDRERKILVGNLRSGKYREIIGCWQAYLQGPDLGDKTPDSERPVAELAREIIFRTYKKIMKMGSSIKGGSPDADLHRLRIRGKKLRYILEFFTSLFPDGEIDLAVKQLKKLQDNLGTFNDLSVQQEMLREYLAGLRPGSRKNQDLAAAIGGLLTDLHHEQQRVRGDFATRFEHFSSAENQLLYAKLFH